MKLFVMNVVMSIHINLRYSVISPLANANSHQKQQYGEQDQVHCKSHWSAYKAFLLAFQFTIRFFIS